MAKDMDHSKETIKQIIEGDIVAAYYYQAGALENGLHYDSQVKKATEVLLDKSEYDRLLSPRVNNTIFMQIIAEIFGCLGKSS